MAGLDQQLATLLAENAGLQKTLDESNDKIQQNEKTMEDIARAVLQKQNRVWSSQVPLCRVLRMKSQRWKKKIVRADSVE